MSRRFIHFIFNFLRLCAVEKNENSFRINQYNPWIFYLQIIYLYQQIYIVVGSRINYSNSTVSMSVLYLIACVNRWTFCTYVQIHLPPPPLVEILVQRHPDTGVPIGGETMRQNSEFSYRSA